MKQRLTIVLMLSLGLIAAGCGDSGGSTADAAVNQADSADLGDGGGGTDADLDGTVASTDAGVGVACGPDFCDPGTQKCCVTPSQGGGTTETCVATGDTCAGAEVTCDGPEDCTAPEICCGSLTGGGQSECAGANSCGGVNDLVLCGTADDCPEAKPFCCANAVLAASACQATMCPP